MDEYAPLEGLRKLGPWEIMSIPDAQRQLTQLARRIAESRDEIALVDAEDRILALVVNPEVLEDLRAELAFAHNEIDRRDGKEPTSHEDFMKELRGEG